MSSRGLSGKGPSAGRRAVGGHATGLARPSPRTVANLMPPCPMMPCPSMWPVPCQAVPHAMLRPMSGCASCHAGHHAMPRTMPGRASCQAVPHARLCTMPCCASCQVAPHARPCTMPCSASCQARAPCHVVPRGRPSPMPSYAALCWARHASPSDATRLCTMAAKIGRAHV